MSTSREIFRANGSFSPMDEECNARVVKEDNGCEQLLFPLKICALGSVGVQGFNVRLTPLSG